MKNQNFGDAVKLLKDGQPLRRSIWPKGFFVFRQVPAEIKKDIVPKMQSLPNAVKDVFIKRFNDPKNQIDAIYYNNQLAHVGLSNLITGWQPSIEDVMAVDWEILN